LRFEADAFGSARGAAALVLDQVARLAQGEHTRYEDDLSGGDAAAKAMYGLAYVLLPRKFTSLQAELDRTLASFKRGGEKEFPREKLAFDDATESLTRLHHATVTFNADGSLSLRDGDPTSSYELCLSRLAEHLAACRLDTFEGKLAEIEPDFDRFVRSFTDYRQRDPQTGRYGRWLNPIGYWDWWELGGRFSGVITGERRPAGAEQGISSGPSAGRAMLGRVVEALGGRTRDEEAAIEANVELVETLKRAEEQHTGLPTAIVLPPGCCPDADRWFDDLSWHEIRPGTRALLGASADAGFQQLAQAAYERFTGLAAAGVAYHF
jgi:hypothetical protein